MLNSVPICFNFDQIFNLKEINMYNKSLLFETTDGMNYFKNSYENFTKLENGNILFRIYFDDYKDLDNIPYLLFDYLRRNDFLYDD